MPRSRLRSAWSGPRSERWTMWLVLAGAAALPLQNTATFDLGFTVRLSHLLFGAALVVGLSFALRGFVLLPPWIRWSAVGLLAIYVVVTATTDLATVAGTPRGGSVRAAVYLADLLLGVALLCIVPGLWRGLRALQPLLLALTFGAGIAALYALWQWPAQHYGLPLADILTTRDSNAITEAGSQGPGLIGWERARGTFLEPHFLGAFMSVAAALAVLAAAQARGIVRVMCIAAAAAMVGALLVSSSAPGYAGFGIAAIASVAAWAIGAGRPRLAAVAGAGVAVGLLAAPTLVAAPEILTTVTGRDAVALTATADFRKQTWNRVLDLWAVQPAGGYGAGQSSVQLSLVTQGMTSRGLNSAQGLWAASLIDVGLVGFGFWVALFGAALAVTLRSAWSQPSLERSMLVFALVSAICSALVATDRLDLRIWLLLGLVAAADATHTTTANR